MSKPADTSALTVLTAKICVGGTGAQARRTHRRPGARALAETRSIGDDRVRRASKRIQASTSHRTLGGSAIGDVSPAYRQHACVGRQPACPGDDRLSHKQAELRDHNHGAQTREAYCASHQQQPALLSAKASANPYPQDPNSPSPDAQLQQLAAAP